VDVSIYFPQEDHQKIIKQYSSSEFQAAVGWEYEGKTEAHVSQKGL